MSNTPSEHDPFASPQSIGPEYVSRPDGGRPPSGAVTAVAVLNYVMGALNIACGGIVVGFGVLASAVWSNAKEQRLRVREEFGEIEGEVDVQWHDVGIGPDLMGIVVSGIVVVIGILMVAVAVAALFAGFGIQKRRPWARIVTIVLAGLCGVLALLHAISLSPFALLYGGYAIYVLVILLQRKYADEFA